MHTLWPVRYSVYKNLPHEAEWWGEAQAVAIEGGWQIDESGMLALPGGEPAESEACIIWIKNEWQVVTPFAQHVYALEQTAPDTWQGTYRCGADNYGVTLKLAAAFRLEVRYHVTGPTKNDVQEIIYAHVNR